MFVFEKPIEVMEVRRGQQCNAPDETSRVYLLNDLAAVQAWEQMRGVNLSNGTPTLPAGPFALVDMGRRNTASYGVAISRMAGRKEEVLTLKGTFITPAAGMMVAQVITSPCVLVSLPSRPYTAVGVVDQSGALRASSQRQPVQ